MTIEKPCYCGSSVSYAQCCEPYHLGLQVPSDPEALMRSRYSAYCLADIAYIQATMAGKASQGFDPNSAKLWAERVIWIALQVLSTSMLSPTKGQVEFIARFVDGKLVRQMHERSEFLFTDGRWFYVDGTQIEPETQATPLVISRNIACPCGNQKKWKHCHGKHQY